MLNFSKINVVIIYFIFIFLAFFSILNFQNSKNSLINKKINLGLDLQGGSYLLLEINSDPLVKEKIQSKVIPLKQLLKKLWNAAKMQLNCIMCYINDIKCYTHRSDKVDEPMK